jgi:ferredoxin
VSTDPSGARLEIDWTRCQGHGLCAEVFPSTILRDEWGYPVFRRHSIEAADLADARRTVAVCPALALRLELTR